MFSSRSAPAGGVMLAAMLLALPGCVFSQRVRVAPRDTREAIARINSNVERINSTLSLPGLTSFSFRDGDGVQRSLVAQEAKLFFRAPRCLLFEVRGLTGTLARVGANEDRYWVSFESDPPKLWWGAWSGAQGVSRDKLPITPAELLDALMLRPLPESYPGSLTARLSRIAPNEERLIFSRYVGKRAVGAREILLDPFEPYQPLGIVDVDADGLVLMDARLGKYERVGDGPYIAREYVVNWPRTGATFRLSIGSGAKFRPDLEDFCDFPARWQGPVEQLDADTSIRPKAVDR